MGENLLSFQGSEQFRNVLLGRNLSPYNLTGYFSQNNPNIEEVVTINFQNSYVNDSQNISETVDGKNKTVEEATRYNSYGPGGPDYRIDIADVISLPNQNQSDGGITLNDGTSFSISNNQPYWPLTETNMDIVNELSIDTISILNKYVSEEGYNSLFFVSDNPLILNGKSKGVYPNFINSVFTVDDVLKGNSNLSQDSYLSQLSANYLEFQIQANIDREIYRNTAGRANFQALTNPFSIAEL